MKALCISGVDVFFTDLVVSGRIIDTLEGDKVPCYTPRPIVLYPGPGATLKAAPTDSKMSVRVKENLIDGVYGREDSECYYGQESYNKQYIYWSLSHSR